MIPANQPCYRVGHAEAPETLTEEVNRAVASAKAAFESWREVPFRNARLMLNYQHLLKQNHDDIAEILARNREDLC